MRPLVKTILIALASAAVVCAAALAWLMFAPRVVPSGQPPLKTLRTSDLPEFRDRFNAADAQVRLLALLSPT